MSTIKKVEYEKRIGCHHNDNGDLVGGIPIPMIALYDADKINDVSRYVRAGVSDENILLIEKPIFENLLTPYFKEFFESHSHPTDREIYTSIIGKRFYYYDENDKSPIEDCLVVEIKFSDIDDSIISITLSFLNDDEHTVDTNTFPRDVLNHLFETVPDVKTQNSIIDWRDF